MATPSKETEIRSVTVGEAKGGATIRFPPEWKLRHGLKGIIPLASEWCEAHQMYHPWILRPGEPMPLCPENLIVCPCGCGRSFRYNRTEQKALREKLGIRPR